MSNDNTNREIVQELYKTLVLLGVDNGLLGTVGAWGDSLPDEDVLTNLRAWNDATRQEVTQRIEHYETSSLHPAHSRAAERRTA